MPEYDPSTREYVYPGGQRITQELLDRKAAATATGIQVSRSGLAGKNHRSAIFQNQNLAQPIHVRDVLNNRYLVNGTVIRFIIEKRTVQQNGTRVKQLHYAALHADGKWYLTGAGEWYGTNVLTKDQMLEVLQRNECVGVQVSEQWVNLDLSPLF